MEARERIRDELLVLRSKSGDPAALGDLLDRWQERLWRHALRLTGDADAAWDVLQDSCLAIGRGLPRLEDEAAFPGWAYRIVSNKCRDWIRQRVRRRQWEAMFAEELERREAEEREREGRVADLRESIARLAGPDRALLALHYEEGFGVAEIAAILDIPAGTVKSRLHHARRRLKNLMEEASS
jgi:RNA polymerase sigma factor (sigma-70 family)